MTVIQSESVALDPTKKVAGQSKGHRTIASSRKTQTNSLTSELGVSTSAAIGQYLRAAEKHGINIDELLRQFDLDAHSLNETQMVTGKLYLSILEEILAQANDPIFGHRASAFVQPASYSVLGYIVLNCKDIRSAMDKIPQYERLVGDMGVSDIVKFAPEENAPYPMAIRWFCSYTEAKIRNQVILNVLASWTQFTRWMVNKPDLTPEEVHFSFSIEDEQAIKELQGFYRCPIKFGQKYDQLLVSESTLNTPLQTPDPTLLKTLEQHAELQLETIKGQKSIRLQVQKIIHEQLGKSHITKETVAENLHISPSTLQRKLSKEGVKFQSLLEDLKRAKAKSLLEESSLPIKTIAISVGFQEPRSFQRSFKSWTGMSPSEYREKIKSKNNT